MASRKPRRTPSPCVRSQSSDRDAQIKVMFAENERLAEDLLCQIRDPGPAGDE